MQILNAIIYLQDKKTMVTHTNPHNTFHACHQDTAHKTCSYTDLKLYSLRQHLSLVHHSKGQLEKKSIKTLQEIKQEKQTHLKGVTSIFLVRLLLLEYVYIFKVDIGAHNFSPIRHVFLTCETEFVLHSREIKTLHFFNRKYTVYCLK